MPRRRAWGPSRARPMKDQRTKKMPARPSSSMPPRPRRSASVRPSPAPGFPDAPAPAASGPSDATTDRRLYDERGVVGGVERLTGAGCTAAVVPGACVRPPHARSRPGRGVRPRHGRSRHASSRRTVPRRVAEPRHGTEPGVAPWRPPASAGRDPRGAGEKPAGGCMLRPRPSPGPARRGGADRGRRRGTETDGVRPGGDGRRTPTGAFNAFWEHSR